MLRPSKLGRRKLRYVFTIEEAWLSCGPRLLQPAVPGIQPTLALIWKSGKKTAYGATVRALQPSNGRGAEWTAPVSLACSVYAIARHGQQTFDSRISQITLRVEGAVDAKRKLAATLDLARYASYQRQSHNVSVALAQGAGTLHFTLSSMWLKRVVGLDEDDSDGSSSASSSSTASSFGHMCGDTSPRTSRSSYQSVDATPGGSRTSIGEGEDSPTKLGHGDGQFVNSCGASTGVDTGMGEHSKSSRGGRALRGMVRATSFGLRSRKDGTRSFNGADIHIPALSGDGIKATKGDACSFSSNPIASSSAVDARPPQPANESSVGDEYQPSSPPRCRHDAGSEELFESHAHATCNVSAVAASAEKSRREVRKRGEIGDDPRSLFRVSSSEMTEALCTQLPIDINTVEQSFLGMDCEDSRFGKLLCSRLAYMQVSPGRWEGSEAEGLCREVSLVVKCPPKPMLPDTTRVVIRHRMQRPDGTTLLLEREVATLDVPYGDSFRVQERWIAQAMQPQHSLPSSLTSLDAAISMNDSVLLPVSDVSPAVQLRVLTRVWFKGRVGLMASKIKHHSMKKSKKVAALACELLMQADLEETAAAARGIFTQMNCDPKPAKNAPLPVFDGAGASGEGTSAFVELREQYDALFEEASYFKRRCNQLERENARLQATSKNKSELLEMVTALEVQLAKERYERAVMEEVLTTAYNKTIREILASAPNANTQEGTICAPTQHFATQDALEVSSSSSLKPRTFVPSTRPER